MPKRDLCVESVLISQYNLHQLQVLTFFFLLGIFLLAKPRMRGFRSPVHAVHALQASPQPPEPPAHAASVPPSVRTSQACAHTLEPSLHIKSAHIRALCSSLANIIAER